MYRFEQKWVGYKKKREQPLEGMLSFRVSDVHSVVK
jgi:hypothetical protein